MCVAALRPSVCVWEVFAAEAERAPTPTPAPEAPSECGAGDMRWRGTTLHHLSRSKRILQHRTPAFVRHHRPSDWRFRKRWV